MAEYISRDTAIARLTKLEVTDKLATMADAKRGIADMPAADVAPVRHGRWETHYRSGTTVSKGVVSGCCDMWNGWKTPYCPNCGAKMDGETEGNDG